jgi:hypothetical protein
VLFCEPAIAAPRQAGALQPVTAIPNIASERSGQYYILLLKWSVDVSMGAVKARVTYLDPPLYLAWLRQSSPDIDQAAFEKGLSGFPETLRFRVAYQAAERSAIHAKEWKLTLETPDGGAVEAKEGKRIQPADLKSGPNGDFWEDDWDYRFEVPAGFLATAKGFAVTLSGPAGSGKAVWTFGAVESASASADGYVVYLGGILSGLSLILLAALFATRPPNPSIQ